MIHTLSMQSECKDLRHSFSSKNATSLLEGCSSADCPRLLPDVLRSGASECGSKIRVVSSADHLSYAEIDLRSDRLASRLIAHNIRPGDRVIIGLPNSGDFITACFAVWKAGAVVVALDHYIRAANLKHILERIEPAALIAANDFAEKIWDMPEVLRFFRIFLLKDPHNFQVADQQVAVESLHCAMMAQGAPAILPATQPDDLATITFTSGSTNLPKGVMHTHESILACASFTLSYLQLSTNDVVMLPLPLHHVLAFRRFLTCFLAQCTLVLAPDIFIMKQFAETRPTGCVLVPSACNILIDNYASFFRQEGECLRYVEIGSEPMAAERVHALQSILPTTRIHFTYGLTEGRVGYLNAGPDETFDLLDCSNDGLEIAVVDNKGAPVSQGQIGEILISGSGLFKGYWGDSTARQKKLKDCGFRTGDMGMLDENNQVRLMGRIDDLVKIGGHKINPREIEAVLQRHPSVAEVVVVGRADSANNLGVALHAFVVRKQGFISTDAELAAHCREHLELYKVPATINFRESFPKTPLGKIQRHLVAQSAEAHVS